MIESSPAVRAVAPLPTLAMAASHDVAYEVHHTAGRVFDLADSLLADVVGSRPVLAVVDETVWELCGDTIRAYLDQRLDNRGVIVVPGTESIKSLTFAATLCHNAFDARIPRDGAFLAIGGGTILDVVGFAASIFRRGINYVRVPTTLIGMIDVSVGIKQAVNVGRHKNIIGSFYAPLSSINDQAFLETLPRRHLACGVSEAIKIALVCDAQLFGLLEQHAPAMIASGFQRPHWAAQEVLRRSEAAMIAQLAPNLHEADRRRLVDFGHTFSPAIESSSDYEVPHGEAVAMDMLLSSIIGTRSGSVPPWLPSRLARLLRAAGLPLTHPSMTPEIMSRAMDDARLHRAAKLNLVVPAALGRGAFVQRVEHADLVHAIDTAHRLDAAT